MAKEKVIPFPSQWTILLAEKLKALSVVAKLRYVWSMAEMGGIAMQWQNQTLIKGVSNSAIDFTLLIHNDGVVMLAKSRGPFSNADAWDMVEEDLDSLAVEIFAEIKRELGHAN
jgi:hypothetical protein